MENMDTMGATNGGVPSLENIMLGAPKASALAAGGVNAIASGLESAFAGGAEKVAQAITPQAQTAQNAQANPFGVGVDALTKQRDALINAARETAARKARGIPGMAGVFGGETAQGAGTATQNAPRPAAPQQPQQNAPIAQQPNAPTAPAMPQPQAPVTTPAATRDWTYGGVTATLPDGVDMNDANAVSEAKSGANTAIDLINFAYGEG